MTTTIKVVQCPKSPDGNHVTELDRSGHGYCKFCGADRGGESGIRKEGGHHKPSVEQKFRTAPASAIMPYY